MGSSSRADETILSWSLVGRPIPAPYQYARHDGHSFRTEESHKIYSPFLRHDIYRQYDSGLIYQQTRWNAFSQPVYRSMGDPPLVPGTRCRDQSSSYPRQIQHFGRPLFEDGQTYQNRMGTGSIDCEFHIPNAQISQCGPVCDTIQSQTPIVCISSSRQPCLSSRCFFNELEPTSCICIPHTILIPSVLAKIRQSRCRIVLIAPLWPQRPWFSKVLQLLVSAPIRLPLFGCRNLSFDCVRSFGKKEGFCI